MLDERKMNMKLLTFVIITLAIYMPFHLFEEALGNFPKWMYEHKWLPYHMTYGHWMSNNIFVYYPMLLLATFIFVIGEENCTCFGIGIIMWGFINFGDHFIYTIKDKKLTAGLITGTLFLINSIFGIRCFLSSELFSVPQLILGILIGGVLFGAPIGFCVVIYNFFKRFD